jgi:hypothetical protein
MGDAFRIGARPSAATPCFAPRPGTKRGGTRPFPAPRPSAWPKPWLMCPGCFPLSRRPATRANGRSWPWPTRPPRPLIRSWPRTAPGPFPWPMRRCTPHPIPTRRASGPRAPRAGRGPTPVRPGGPWSPEGAISPTWPGCARRFGPENPIRSTTPCPSRPFSPGTPGPGSTICSPARPPGTRPVWICPDIGSCVFPRSCSSGGAAGR